MDFAIMPPQAVVAAGLCVRLAAVLLAAATALPGLTVRALVALAAALAMLAFPSAVATSPLVTAGLGPFGCCLAVAGEAAAGLAIGTAVAAIASAGAWAGGILGSVSGLSWADDFAPDGDAQSAGMARLAWWIGCGGFLAAGGIESIAAGLVDSVRTLPVGGLLPIEGAAAPSIVDVAVSLPAAALALAVTLAIPALVAVVCFHLACAICLRAVPFTPASGLLQALAALVLLAAVYLGADAWSTGFGVLAQGPIEQCFGAR
jgi:flagellar biosynthesis protein FliR